jgi:cation:H+ antiporter
LISLIILVSSAKLVVWGGTNLALAFGVSDLIIGLTVVALGTSLPELAVAISSALKRQHQMIIGNIIGSNLFNTLGVLAIPGLIHPFQIPAEVMSRDYIYMITLTLLILILSIKLKINRYGGLILLAILASYLYRLVWI